MSCLADSFLPPCWLLLYAAAALLGDGEGGLFALLHCCLGDPWAGVGLVLILKSAKHLCSPTAARLLGTEMPPATNPPLLLRHAYKQMEDDIAKLIKSSRQCSTIDKRGPNLLATPL
ncbi:hypothetical protein V8C86DRAFT_2758675 [Haematococcus lacustris]